MPNFRSNATERPYCNCGCGKLVAKKGSTALGFPIWRKLATACYTKKYNLRKRYGKKFKNPYIRFRKEYCEECGFIPKHMCQLDVDHIDGNHSNNNPDNLQTLCANCHRLKTYLNKDWENKA